MGSAAVRNRSPRAWDECRCPLCTGRTNEAFGGSAIEFDGGCPTFRRAYELVAAAGGAVYGEAGRALERQLAAEFPAMKQWRASDAITAAWNEVRRGRCA